MYKNFIQLLKSPIKYVPVNIIQKPFSRDFHYLTKPNIRKYCAKKIEICPIRASATRDNHYDAEKERKQRLPSIVYIQHPWKFLKAKLQFLRLKLFWDQSFKEDDFIFGSKQAVVYLTELIRNQEAVEIGNITTPMGFKQITRDMILSRDDPRLNLVQFRRNDIKKAIPVKIAFVQRAGRKFCIVDMFFVGMRNVQDFGTFEDTIKMNEYLRKWEKLHSNRESRISKEEEDFIRKAKESLITSRAVFAEIFTRFYKEYTSQVTPDWFISFYKIVSFDVLTFH